MIRGVLKPEKHERRDWREIIVLRVALVSPKLDDTIDNSQREPPHHFKGRVSPY